MIQQYDNCVECKACVQICPQNCIQIQKERLSLNKKQCINCGLCDRVCQIQNPVCYGKSNKVYAAVGKNEEAINNSSSGGIANILYQYVLDQGGIVFGAKYMEGLVPNITYTDNKNDLDPFLKSKYCFSDVGDSYKKCKEFCENKKIVMYIGLPCQIAGLKLYLMKDYENLFLVDILCHGAPHYDIFKNHINYLENKKKSKIINYQFREKKYDIYGPYHYTITYEDKTEETGSALWDAYYNAFLKANIFRKACYSCKYAREERVSDITLGDFWKAREDINQFGEKKYISSIIVSTEKGKNILDKCKKKMYLYQSGFEILKKSTHAVFEPAKKQKNVNVEKLKEYRYYVKWASRYENSLKVIVRKIKNMVMR